MEHEGLRVVQSLQQFEEESRNAHQNTRLTAFKPPNIKIPTNYEAALLNYNKLNN
jgi:hypothetical protein